MNVCDAEITERHTLLKYIQIYKNSPLKTDTHTQISICLMVGLAGEVSSFSPAELLLSVYGVSLDSES